MSKVCRLILSISTLMLIAGCCGDTMKGSWVLCENQPYLEKADYQIVKLSFYDNGSYAEVGSKGGKTIKSKGCYDYDACSDDLILRSGDKARCYKLRCASSNKILLDMCGPGCCVTTAVMVRDCLCPCPCKPCCPPCPRPRSASSPCSNCP